MLLFGYLINILFTNISEFSIIFKNVPLKKWVYLLLIMLKFWILIFVLLLIVKYIKVEF